MQEGVLDYVWPIMSREVRLNLVKSRTPGAAKLAFELAGDVSADPEILQAALQSPEVTAENVLRCDAFLGRGSGPEAITKLVATPGVSSEVRLALLQKTPRFVGEYCAWAVANPHDQVTEEFIEVAPLAFVKAVVDSTCSNVKERVEYVKSLGFVAAVEVMSHLDVSKFPSREVRKLLSSPPETWLDGMSSYGSQTRKSLLYLFADRPGLNRPLVEDRRYAEIIVSSPHWRSSWMKFLPQLRDDLSGFTGVKFDRAAGLLRALAWSPKTKLHQVRKLLTMVEQLPAADLTSQEWKATRGALQSRAKRELEGSSDLSTVEDKALITFLEGRISGQKERPYEVLQCCGNPRISVDRGLHAVEKIFRPTDGWVEAQIKDLPIRMPIVSGLLTIPDAPLQSMRSTPPLPRTAEHGWFMAVNDVARACRWMATTDQVRLWMHFLSLPPELGESAGELALQLAE